MLHYVLNIRLKQQDNKDREHRAGEASYNKAGINEIGSSSKLVSWSLNY